MATPKLPPRVHRVRRAVKDGVRFHFYAWRGGPKFWVDGKAFPSDPAFYQAYAEKTALPKPTAYMATTMVDDFLSSGEMPKAERTRKDYRLWALRFAKAFKDDPAALFEEPASRIEVDEWRQAWAHSPKQYDYAGAVVTRILNWAKKGRKIREHHCDGFEKVYRPDRAEIVWSSSDQNAVLAIAPTWIQRILITACETGLRPGDLIRLSRAHIQSTPNGQRIQIRTNKRKITATIPLTPAMTKVVQETPDGQMLILTNASGEPLTEHRVSEGLRQWRDKAGLDEKTLGYSLRLYDTRGTAATRLLNAGLTLKEIAQHMGWSLRTASYMIEKYAAVSPDETDVILAKLTEARRTGR
ncbi:tyrosine-type recombinase/integrase [Aphanothece microscopica]|uniref:tyrosine-type recombinase/integrase n=1 Tax=Aphanothece microscopica TaxID=1049561 RepID=UPI0039853694